MSGSDHGAGRLATARERLARLADAYEPGMYALCDGVYHVYADVPECCQALRDDLRFALVAEEQVAGDSSREANETDWKARCEAAEQALEGMRKHLIWCANHADECLGDHPARLAEIMRVASVTPGRAALNPTPQGGKPDSEEG